jgi:hypothetical protein
MIYRPDGQTVTNFALKVERGAHTIVFGHNTLSAPLTALGVAVA